MIRVAQAAEPSSFDVLVRQRGALFLSKCPKPTASQWRTHDYWNLVKKEFRTTYNEVCAYSCHWIPADTGANTVEHFRPKDVHPADAYDWSNYRLVCGTLNGRKGTRSVIDPFAVDDDWFLIEFPSLLVKPSSQLSEVVATQVQETIDVLKLNDESTCLQNRQGYVTEFCQAHISLDFLRRRAPFLAREIERQGLVNTIGSIMNIAP
jgi:uncharacterized protein (TIGR02646 family)